VRVSTFGAGLGDYWHSAFSADGSLLAVGGFDGTVHVFDASTGALVQTYRGHSSGVEHAVLSVDNSRLLTSSEDGTARLWDTATATELQRFVHGEGVRQSALTASGDEVFTAGADGTVRRWTASATGEDFTFRAGNGEVSGLAFSTDGQHLATAGGDNLRIFGLASGSLDVDAERLASRLVAFAPTGDYVLSVSSFGSSLLDAQTGAEIRPLSVSSDAGQASAASFSADGRLVLGTDSDLSTQVVYEASTGDIVGSVDIDTAVLSADGLKVAGWAPGRYSIYDVLTGNALQAFGLDGIDPRPIDIAFTPDGSRIVTGDHDNVVRVREIATRAVILEMPGHSSPIRQVRVSADGAYALTASDDGGARLWSLVTGDLLRIYPGHDGRALTSVAFSPDGQLVALGSADGSVIISSVSLDEVVADVCSVLTRDLTHEERLAYDIQDQSPTCP
jgi:WD40 repeat protein